MIYIIIGILVAIALGVFFWRRSKTQKITFTYTDKDGKVKSKTKRVKLPSDVPYSKEELKKARQMVRAAADGKGPLDLGTTLQRHVGALEEQGAKSNRVSGPVSFSKKAIQEREQARGITPRRKVETDEQTSGTENEETSNS